MYKKIFTTSIIGAIASSVITFPVNQTNAFSESSAVNFILVQYLINEIDTNISNAGTLTNELLNEQIALVDSNAENQVDREAVYEHIDIYRAQLLDEYISTHTESNGFINLTDELRNFFATTFTYFKTTLAIEEAQSAFANIERLYTINASITTYLSEGFDLTILTRGDIDAIEEVVSKQEESDFKNELSQKIKILRNNHAFALFQKNFIDARDIDFSILNDLEDTLENTTLSEEQLLEFSNLINNKRFELIHAVLDDYNDSIVDFENLSATKSILEILDSEILLVKESEPETFAAYEKLSEMTNLVNELFTFFDESGLPNPTSYSNMKLDSIKVKFNEDVSENQLVFLNSTIDALEIALSELGNEETIEFNTSTFNHRQIFKTDESDEINFIFDDAVVRINESDLLGLGEGLLQISFIRDLINKFFEISIQQQLILGNASNENEVSVGDFKEVDIDFNYEIQLNSKIDSNEVISIATNGHERFVWQKTTDEKTKLKANNTGKFEMKVKNENKFTDINTSTIAGLNIKQLFEQRLLRGISDSKFGGERGLTRAEAATIMLRVMGKSSSPMYAQTFRDTKKGSWYYDSVSTAAHYGYMNGLTKFEFMPNKVLTKEEAAVVIHRLIRLNNISLRALNSSHVSDLSEASAFSKNSIQQLVNAGIIELDNGHFNPKGNITREEMANLLKTALDVY